MAESESDINITTDTPYLAITGELCGVYCEALGENWPFYNGTALQCVNNQLWLILRRLTYVLRCRSDNCLLCSLNIWKTCLRQDACHVKPRGCLTTSTIQPIRHNNRLDSNKFKLGLKFLYLCASNLLTSDRPVPSSNFKPISKLLTL